ncbi:MAG: chalcone isomerase family protein [Thiomonas sp.]
MSRRALLGAGAICALALLPPVPALAAGAEPPPEVSAAIAQVRRSGSGEFRYFGFLIYRATLWVGPQGLGASIGDAPFALQLRYARSLKGADIAARSEEEMRKLGEGSAQQRADWLQAMRQLFPDVHDGDTLTGVFTPATAAQPAQTRFYYNGRLRGSVTGTAFARAFFSIWLSPKTPAPGLRDDLLAQSAAAASAP